MSDFLSELRREVTDAHAANARRGPAWQALRTLRALLAPGHVLGLATVVALLALVIVLARDAPQERTSGPDVIATLDIGGLPVAAVFAGDSLWVIDASGQAVIRIDPREHRVLDRLPLDGPPTAVAAADGEVWVRAGRPGGDMTQLVRIDTATTATLGRIELGPGTPLATTSGAAWAEVEAAADDVPKEGLYRVDRATSEKRRLDLTGGATLAGAQDTLWVLRTDGELVAIDPATGGPEQRFEDLLPVAGSGAGAHALAADDTGAWALGTAPSGDAELVRAEAGGETARVRLPAATLPVLAADADSVWTASRNIATGTYAVHRLDPRTGRRTATVALGSHRPIALEIEHSRVWALGGDGTVTVIGA
jgi:hypothetical protein